MSRQKREFLRFCVAKLTSARYRFASTRFMSAKRLVLFGAFLLSVLVALQGTESNRVVINHVTVIDGTGVKPRENVDVVVSAGRIVALQKGAETNATDWIVDATGKFLI